METNRPYSCVEKCGYFCVKKWGVKELQCLRGCAMAEEAFAVVEIYVSLEAAMGMMVANGDESTIVVFVCVCECVM